MAQVQCDVSPNIVQDSGARVKQLERCGAMEALRALLLPSSVACWLLCAGCSQEGQASLQHNSLCQCS